MVRFIQRCDLYSDKYSIKTEFIAINSTNTSLYMILYLWLLAKQPKLTIIFVNIMGITQGIAAMAFDKFLIYILKACTST